MCKVIIHSLTLLLDFLAQTQSASTSHPHTNSRTPSLPRWWERLPDARWEACLQGRRQPHSFVGNQEEFSGPPTLWVRRAVIQLQSNCNFPCLYSSTLILTLFLVNSLIKYDLLTTFLQSFYTINLKPGVWNTDSRYFYIRNPYCLLCSCSSYSKEKKD